MLGWDPRQAELIVGTSAGAELAALLGAGVPLEAMLAAAVGAAGADARLTRRIAAAPRAFPPAPALGGGSARLALRLVGPGGARPAPLAAITALLPRGRGDLGFLCDLVDGYVPPGAWAPHPATWIVAADSETGARVAFGANGAPVASLRDAVCASWAIPGWFPAVSIGGRSYADGGVCSPASADLVLSSETPIDEAIVLAPMASREAGRRRGLAWLEGAVRAHMTRTLDAEIARLAASRVRVLRIEPDAEDLRVMGGNFMDGARRLRVLEHSLRAARRRLPSVLAASGVTLGSEGASAWPG
jgi:NTE family protein